MSVGGQPLADLERVEVGRLHVESLCRPVARQGLVQEVELLFVQCRSQVADSLTLDRRSTAPGCKKNRGLAGSSGRDPTAFNVEHLAVDVAGAVRREKEDSFGDLAWIAK